MVILLFFCLRTHSGPHVVLHLQGLVFPLAHLHRGKQETQKPLARDLSSPSWHHPGKQTQASYVIEGKFFLNLYAQKESTMSVCKKGNTFICSLTYQTLVRGSTTCWAPCKTSGLSEASFRPSVKLTLSQGVRNVNKCLQQ